MRGREPLGLAIVILLSIFGNVDGGFPNSSQIERAYNFLISLYNPNLGLVCESYEAPFNTTYWIYSDNLIVSYALAPYSPYYSRIINETVRRYMVEAGVGMPHKFEVLFGYDIPDTILSSNVYIIEDHGNYVIKIDRADGEPLRVEDYADLCFYKALDCYFEGEFDRAKHHFEIGYNMFDGIGFYDKATKVDGLYANYKLALCIYTAKVLGLSREEYPALDIMERRLWEAQNERGGIITHRDLEGNLVGLANAETTALTLLIYNDELIRSLNPNLNEGNNWGLSQYFGIGVFIGLVLWCLYKWLFKVLSVRSRWRL